MKREKNYLDHFVIVLKVIIGKITYAERVYRGTISMSQKQKHAFHKNTPMLYPQRGFIKIS